MQSCQENGAQTMPLTDIAIRSLVPGDKAIKKTDEKGLFLLLQPSGSKLWRFKYRFPEQEWLLPGRRVDQVVPCRDGTPARIVAPDPRWFALHKLWLGAQAKRNPLKRRKDTIQGTALLDAVAGAMPHYPLDDAFAATIPEELRAYWNAWKQRA